jgi:hypothetical protein
MMNDDTDDDGEVLSLLRRVARTPDVSAVRRELTVGSELVGRFKIEHKLGEGGMGRVYAAFDRARQARVALKVLGILTPRTIAAIKLEFRVAAELLHPNLVRLHELFSDGKDWFFTMDLVEGVTLHRLRHDGGRLSVEEIRHVFGQLALALDELHLSGALHGDLKPSNFLLVGSEHQVVLLDFGLTRSLGSAAQEHAFAGTPAYMAPEQATGQPLTEAADWYSFAVVLFEALTGGLPSPLTFQMHGAMLPMELGALCLGLLHPDPSQRPKAESVLRATGVLSGDRRGYAKAPPSSSSLIGRRAEVDRLLDAYEVTVGGQAKVVLVSGESGIGKTALIGHFVAEVARRGATVLAGRCRERESVSYKALDGLMDDLVKYLEQAPPATARSLLPEGIADLTRLFPTLRTAAAVAHYPRPAIEVSDQSLVKQHAIAAFRELLGALRARAPLVLWIDDLQWSDTHSAELLEPLLAGGSALPVLLVGSLRTSGPRRGATLDFLFRQDGADLPKPVLIEVPPLANLDAEALAEALLTASNVNDPATARSIAREAGGHPLFIAELVHSQMAHRPVPASNSLSQLINQRLHALSSDALGLLEAMALAGAPVSRTVVHRARSLAPDRAERAFDLLRVNRLAVALDLASEHVVDVHHDRIREIIVQGMPVQVRQDHHRKLARAFEAERGTSPDVLATHFQAAGDLAEAGRHWIEAGHAAYKALAFAYAAELYEKGAANAPLEADALHRVLVRRAEALAYAGQATLAAEEYLKAARDHDRDEALELRRRAAEQLLLAGHLERGLAVIDVVLKALDMRKTMGGPRVLPSILLGRLMVRTRGLDFKPRQECDIGPKELARVDATWSIACSLGVIDFMRGADFQNDHLLLALKAGEPRRLLRALTLEISYAATPGLGSGPRTQRLLQMADELAAQSNEPTAIGFVRVSRGVAAYLNGRFDEALTSCEQGVAILSRHSGTVWETVTAQRFMIASLFQLGRLRVLAELVPPLLAEAIGKGNLYASTYFRSSYSTTAWLAHDDVAVASDQLSRARAGWTAAGVQLPHSWMLIGQAHLALYTDETQKLWQDVQEAWPRFVKAQFLRIAILRIQLWQLRGMSASAAAWRCRQAGQELAARRLYGIAHHSAARLLREKLALASPLATLMLSAVEYATGNQQRALDDLGRCIAGFEQQEMAGYAAAAKVRMGEIIGGQQGNQLVASAHATLSAEGVANVSRFVNVLAPRFLAIS